MSAFTVRRLASAAGLVLAAVAVYLCFWPVPAEPVSWLAPTPPGYTGAHASNTRLSGLRTIDIGDEFGPEHIAVGPDNKLYAAMTSGNLLRMDPDGARQEIFANTRYPDNLMRGRDGRIWVGLFRPRNPAADGLSQKPFMRYGKRAPGDSNERT